MTVNFKKYLSAIIVIQLFVVNIFCQKTKITSDFRIVSEAGVIKSLYKKWEVGLGAKCWLEKNASQIGEINLDAEVAYNPVKYIALQLGYRWTQNRNKDDVFISKHRFGANVDFITKIDKLRIDYRICFQNIDDDFFQEDDENPAKYILRNRIQIKYKIPRYKLTPFALIEHYGQFGQTIYGIKIKSEVGASYHINKNQQLIVYYRIDRELNADYPYTFYTVGLGYTFDF